MVAKNSKKSLLQRISKTASKKEKSPTLSQSFQKLVEVVVALRGPKGCPWDKAQTPKTLAPFAIEEAYELVEALEEGDRLAVVEELGDVLFQVLLHSEVGRQESKFTLQDVIETLREKMVRRHPHVFGTIKLNTPEAVMANWAKIKEQEKTASKDRIPKSRQKAETSLTQNIPKHLPALQVAQKIGARTRKVGFDWQNPMQVLEKVHEEIQELSLEMKSLPSTKRGRNTSKSKATSVKKKIEHEIGDALFAMAQLARHCDLEPEQCLRVANARFVRRYAHMVSMSGESESHFASLTPEEKERLWKRAKKNEKSKSKKSLNR